MIDNRDILNLPFWIKNSEEFNEVCISEKCDVFLMSYDSGLPYSGMHKNEYWQWIVVLDGTAEVFLGTRKEKVIIKKGDTLFIDKNEPHGVNINKGYKDLTIRGK